MQEFIDAIDGLPAVVKYLLCIPVVSVVWMIYRICRSVAHNNTLGLVLGMGGDLRPSGLLISKMHKDSIRNAA